MSVTTAPPRVAPRRRGRRVLARHRRLLVALLTGAAVTAGLSALAPAPPPSVTVLVAARDLPGGLAIGGSDLAAVTLPRPAVPDGAFLKGGEPPLGRVLATAVRRGEPLTDARLVGPGLLAGSSGLVAVPVRLADAGAAALLRAGDSVDVLGVRPDDPVAGATDTAAAGDAAVTVAADVRVLAVPEVVADGSGLLVVLAATAAQARELAAAEASARLSVVVRPQETPG